MRRTLFLLFFLILSVGTQFAHAQTDSRAIEVETSFWGLKNSQNGQRLNLRQAHRMMEPVPDAFALMKKARSQYAFGNVLAFMGGAAAGYTAATAFSGNGEKSHTLIGAGAAIGLLGAAIPLGISATKNIHRAVGLYNDALGSGRAQSYTLHTAVSGNGISLLVKF